MSRAIDDLDTPSNKIGESAQRIIDRAENEARRRNQVLTTEHVFLAFAQAEWELFAQINKSEIRQEFSQ